MKPNITAKKRFKKAFESNKIGLETIIAVRSAASHEELSSLASPSRKLLAIYIGFAYILARIINIHFIILTSYKPLFRKDESAKCRLFFIIKCI